MKEKTLREEFLAAIAGRLEVGARDYGNESFHKPVAATEEEILAELLDVAGWAYVLWVQMRVRLQKLAIAAELVDKSVVQDREER